MNNQKVWDYIRELDIHVHTSGRKFLAEKCIKDGYGQSCGGYLNDCKKTGLRIEIPTQKEHFLNYYEDKKSKQPSYNYLKCPQLILFIAEVSGLSLEKLEDAFNILRDYVDCNNLRYSSNKNGNYIWGKQEFRDFKIKLHISDIVKIIIASENWDDVLKQTAKL